MSEYWKVTTEGDGEGKSIRTVGIYHGTKEQVAQYLHDNGIKPYYDFYFQNVPEPVTDVTHIFKIDVEVKDFGHSTVKIIPSKDAKERAMKNAALAKLSEEERKLLGV